MNYKDLLGQRVMNRYQPHLKGVVVEVLEGCNALVAVVFDGRDFKSWLPPSDVTVIQSS